MSLPARMTCLAVGLCLAAATFIDAATGPVDEDPTLWPEEERAFFQDGPGLLLSAAERAELLALDADGRSRFVADFLARDPLPETPADELGEGIERRRRLAARTLPTPLDVRAQLLFLNGEPAERYILECTAVFRPLEIWTYSEGAGEGAATASEDPLEGSLLVYEPGPGKAWELWLPADGKRVLYTPEMVYWLEQWEELQGRLIQARRFDLQLCDEARRVDRATGVHGLTDARRGRPRPEDYARFLEPPSDLAAWARRAAATELPELPAADLGVEWLALQFPEARGQRIVVRAVLKLPGEAAEVAADGEKSELRLRAEAMVEQDGEIFDRFTVRFKPEPPAAGVPVALVLERPLRPGGVAVLRLRVADEVGGGETRLVRGFAVPAAPQPVAEPPVPDDVILALGEELGRQRLAGRDSLILVPPAGDILMGLWRAEALVTGERIVKVVFLVDGRPQLTRVSPPWNAEIRLAALPTEQVVRAEGYDAAGELVAADEVVINQPRGALRVRIVEPERGVRAVGTVTVRVEVVVPEERRVERVEFRLDDELVTALDRPPWEAQVEVPAGAAFSYLAVVVLLDDGSRAEDVRFLNTPQFFEEVDVNLVELYTAVVDRDGRLVRGLGPDDFTVFENGRRQTIVKFELVEDLPLTVGIAIDTSSSMDRSLPEAKRAASGFLAAVVRSGDRAFAVSFDDRPRLLAPPTGDPREVIDLLAGLAAHGWTALHDAVVTSLYFFRGLRGQRALVLLSDGDDTRSDIAFRDALEYGRRSGVSIYSVGLAGRLKSAVRGKLTSLAEETGGRSFLIDRAEDLEGVYAEIEEELRSRYLIAYNSDRPPEGAGGGEFREIEVEVRGRGLKARTIRGYYP